MKSVFITGDSHIAILRKAQQQLASNENHVSGVDCVMQGFSAHEYIKEFYVEMEGHAKIISPRMVKRQPQLPPIKTYDYYGLSAPLHSLWFFRSKAWLKYAPYHLLKNETPISRSVIEASVIEEQKYVLNLIDIFVDNKLKIFAIEPPRVFRHHSSLQKIRSDLVLYADEIYREIIMCELNKKGVPVVTLPNDVVDDEGYMKDAYRSPRDNDSHHGNVELGILMMNRIENLCLNWGEGERIL